jgi:hypothetical protein
MKKYTWKVGNDKVMVKYNLSKRYQHGDILWKLHENSIEAIGNKNLFFVISIVSKFIHVIYCIYIYNELYNFMIYYYTFDI